MTLAELERERTQVRNCICCERSLATVIHCFPDGEVFPVCQEHFDPTADSLTVPIVWDWQ